MGVGNRLPAQTMAEVQPNVGRQITGDDIISEILRNCEAGAFKIRYSTVLPCIFHVYLHPADYDAIAHEVEAQIHRSRPGSQSGMTPRIP